jgi:hypothetical protein
MVPPQNARKVSKTMPLMQLVFLNYIKQALCQSERQRAIKVSINLMAVYQYFPIPDKSRSHTKKIPLFKVLDSKRAPKFIEIKKVANFKLAISL